MHRNVNLIVILMSLCYILRAAKIRSMVFYYLIFNVPPTLII